MLKSGDDQVVASGLKCVTNYCDHPCPVTTKSLRGDRYDTIIWKLSMSCDDQVVARGLGHDLMVNELGTY